jgi:hypothetical protein
LQVVIVILVVLIITLAIAIYSMFQRRQQLNEFGDTPLAASPSNRTANGGDTFRLDTMSTTMASARVGNTSDCEFRMCFLLR